MPTTSRITTATSTDQPGSARGARSSRRAGVWASESLPLGVSDLMVVLVELTVAYRNDIT
jgi:hypothetical protein